MKKLIETVFVVGLSVLLTQSVLADVSSVSAAKFGDHSGAVKRDGKLFLWGNNQQGQIGNGFEIGYKDVPTRMGSDVKVLSEGKDYTAALKQDGTLWMTGSNEYGQFGNGTKTNSTTFEKVMGGVEAVSTGYDHTAVIKRDGSLWLFGHNEYGELCSGTTVDSSTPIKVAEDVLKVSLGYQYTVFMKKDGSVWGCGYNYDGVLGQPISTYAESIPVEIAVLSESNERLPIKDFSAGFSHLLLLLENGDLYGRGSDHYGSFCLGDDFSYSYSPKKIISGVKKVNAGFDLTAFIKDDGTLWMCGHNYWGQLGIGIIGDGINNNAGMSEPQKVLENVEDVSLGAKHVIALTDDGFIYAWGDNSVGQLGIDYITGKEIITPTQVYFPISLPKGKKLPYNGKKQIGVSAGYGYKVKGNTAVNVGNYKATLTLLPKFRWEDGTKLKKSVKWQIVKGNNPLSVVGKIAKVKYSVLQKKNIKLPQKKVLIIKNKIGKLRYKKYSGDKKITVNALTGNVTVMCGLKKGSYSVRVKVTSNGNKQYKAVTESTSFTVKIL